MPPTSRHPFARDASGGSRPWTGILDRPVSLERLELLELAVPQVESFRSAVGERHERLALFVRWHDGEGGWGLGECSCRPDPFYSGEFVEGALRLIEDHVFPLLPRKGTLGEVLAALGRIRGWPFACAAVLEAVLDLGRRRGLPDFVDLWPGPKLESLPVGISLGLFDGPGQAVDRVTRAVEEGYRRVKLKISPVMDRAPVDAVRKAFPDLHLGFDANGTFSESDVDSAASLAELEPEVLEQPFGPGRLDLCRTLKDRVPELRLCLDESLTGVGTLETAHRLGVLDEANLKPGRVGGQLEAVRFLAACGERETPAWVGGMFETGVGRMANLRVAACLPVTAIHDLSPSRRYFVRDVVRRPVEMSVDGTIDLTSDGPVEPDGEAIESMLLRRIDLGKSS